MWATDPRERCGNRGYPFLLSGPLGTAAVCLLAPGPLRRQASLIPTPTNAFFRFDGYVLSCVSCEWWCFRVCVRVLMLLRGVLHLMVLLSWLELHIRGLLDKLLSCALMMVGGGADFLFAAPVLHATRDATRSAVPKRSSSARHQKKRAHARTRGRGTGMGWGPLFYSDFTNTAKHIGSPYPTVPNPSNKNKQIVSKDEAD